MTQTRIVMPATAKKGAIIEIKTLIQHHMETGYRRDAMGRPIERDIIKTLSVTYSGAEIFRAECGPGVAANPYFAFSALVTETGEFVFTWTDEKGAATVEKRTLTVS